MKIIKNILVVFLFLGSSMLFAQKETEVINKANGLVKEKKYESAFDVLEKFDPKNKNPEVFLLKQDIVLKYFVTSLSHKMFSLKDIKPDEDIMDYRGKEGSSSAKMFDIEENLNELIKKHPKNYKLYKSLADFYYDAMLKYGNWTKAEGELKVLIEKNYKIAIENNAGDYMSHYSLGYLAILDEKFKDAIGYFSKSIELNNEYPTSNYNLSLAYLYSEDPTNALKYALKAYELYQEKEYKCDAARLVSQLYYETKDMERALNYIEIADQILPDNYYNLKLMVKLLLEKKHLAFYEKLNAFFNLAPANPAIYNDLEEIFYKSEQGERLVDFLNEKKNEKGYDDNTLGAIYFHIAKFSLYNGNKKVIKENALKAKGYFDKVFEKDHEIFSLIDQLISKSEQ
ncbi:hypothetical protein NAT51_08470 [Flavobacterium amniphilum]|uniref:tetratricopeptide repeat protein n=1 Tax=Flavobacterium amniphilum TaxID=1834035 RepID=UPI00202A329A|nr:hypothetical protein [Flavobacterium amniphilum]MCL9805554.1 hypothetical protein [Flavobacterium amniphilum]